eukprot:CAMPEP_0179004712 /NCGR_PEP_ID=MMETSP0795-20121207/13473_1 /TAXON_ID=88552 /ORGANISM="Amoebophrya sp., Strain Ameob2" /LENGTH=2090 /DNA_ID=CAMNT_0020699037 /DNA_START=13 /DNA_END=6285 /DNA_ORIENTATION=+
MGSFRLTTAAAAASYGAFGFHSASAELLDSRGGEESASQHFSSEHKVISPSAAALRFFSRHDHHARPEARRTNHAASQRAPARRRPKDPRILLEDPDFESLGRMLAKDGSVTERLEDGATQVAPQTAVTKTNIMTEENRHVVGAGNAAHSTAAGPNSKHRFERIPVVNSPLGSLAASQKPGVIVPSSDRDQPKLVPSGQEPLVPTPPPANYKTSQKKKPTTKKAPAMAKAPRQEPPLPPSGHVDFVHDHPPAPPPTVPHNDHSLVHHKDSVPPQTAHSEKQQLASAPQVPPPSVPEGSLYLKMPLAKPAQEQGQEQHEPAIHVQPAPLLEEQPAPNGTNAEPSTELPVMDERKIKHLTLENGLQTALVQDKLAPRAALSVAVRAGSANDPPDLPGLAHFLEHMLFLGSEQFPDTDGFGKLISNFDGSDNAYTDQDLTVYFNEFSPAGLEHLAPVFAGFFQNATLNASMVEKEVNAVDQEHTKNMNDMTRRMWELLRSESAQKDNPLSHFFTGNKDTLFDEPGKRGIDTSVRLRMFYDQYYCPKNMKLVIIAPFELDEMERIAKKDFAFARECAEPPERDIPGSLVRTEEQHKEAPGAAAAPPALLQQEKQKRQPTADQLLEAAIAEEQAKHLRVAATAERAKLHKAAIQEQSAFDSYVESREAADMVNRWASSNTTTGGSTSACPVATEPATSQVARYRPPAAAKQEATWAEAFPKDTLGRKFLTNTLSQPQIWMMFPLRILELERKDSYGVDSYLSYVAGDGGPKALRTVLRMDGLVDDISLWYMPTKAGSALYVILTLTDKADTSPDARAKVWQTLFRWFQRLRTQSDEDLQKYIESIKKNADVHFKWASRGGAQMDVAAGLAKSLTMYEPHRIVSGGNVIPEISVCLVKAVLEALKAENMNYAYATKQSELLSSDNTTMPYYLVQYTEGKIPSNFINAMDAPPASQLFGTSSPDETAATVYTGDIELPPPLRLIPSSERQFLPVKDQHDIPDHFVNLDLYYYAQQPKLETPKVQIGFLLKDVEIVQGGSAAFNTTAGGPEESSGNNTAGGGGQPPQNASLLAVGKKEPFVRVSLRRRMLSDIRNGVVGRILEPVTSDFSNAGSGYSFATGISGMSFGFSGFPEHIPELMEVVTGVALDPVHSAQTKALFDGEEVVGVKRMFKQVVELMQSGLEDLSSMLAIQHAAEYQNVLTTQASFTREEQLGWLEQYTGKKEANAQTKSSEQDDEQSSSESETSRWNKPPGGGDSENKGESSAPASAGGEAAAGAGGAQNTTNADGTSLQETGRERDTSEEFAAKEGLREPVSLSPEEAAEVAQDMSTLGRVVDSMQKIFQGKLDLDPLTSGLVYEPVIPADPFEGTNMGALWDEFTRYISEENERLLRMTALASGNVELETAGTWTRHMREMLTDSSINQGHNTVSLVDPVTGSAPRPPTSATQAMRTNMGFVDGAGSTAPQGNPDLTTKLAFQDHVLKITDTGGKGIEMRVANPIDSDANDATRMTWQFGIANTEEKVLLNLLAPLVYKETFGFLRTKHTLGYVAFAKIFPHMNVVEYVVGVQGTKKNPDEIVPLVRENNELIRKVIESMSDQEIGERANSLLHELTQPMANLGELHGYALQEIADESMCFQKKHFMVDYLKNVLLPKIAAAEANGAGGGGGGEEEQKQENATNSQTSELQVQEGKAADEAKDTDTQDEAMKLKTPELSWIEWIFGGASSDAGKNSVSLQDQGDELLPHDKIFTVAKTSGLAAKETTSFLQLDIMDARHLERATGGHAGRSGSRGPEAAHALLAHSSPRSRTRASGASSRQSAAAGGQPHFPSHLLRQNTNSHADRYRLKRAGAAARPGATSVLQKRVQMKQTPAQKLLRGADPAEKSKSADEDPPASGQRSADDTNSRNFLERDEKSTDPEKDEDARRVEELLDVEVSGDSCDCQVDCKCGDKQSSAVEVEQPKVTHASGVQAQLVAIFDRFMKNPSLAIKLFGPESSKLIDQDGVPMITSSAAGGPQPQPSSLAKAEEDDAVAGAENVEKEESTSLLSLEADESAGDDIMQCGTNGMCLVREVPDFSERKDMLEDFAYWERKTKCEAFSAR